MAKIDVKEQTGHGARQTGRKKRGALLVYERLRDDIMWLHVEPASALDEVALAAKFDVSRTPIREALLLLANEGFVQFLPNRTTIVAPLSLHNTAELFDTLILLSRALVRSVTMVGTAEAEVLSGFVTGFAEGLDRGDHIEAFRSQIGLYHHLAQLTGNRFLKKYLLEAQDASVRLKQIYFFPQLTTQERATATAHLKAIVEALLKGDPEASDRAVRESLMFEVGVIQRGLGPRFGHRMDIGDQIAQPEK